jgi:hypothetical protein
MSPHPLVNRKLAAADRYFPPTSNANPGPKGEDTKNERGGEEEPELKS